MFMVTICKDIFSRSEHGYCLRQSVANQKNGNLKLREKMLKKSLVNSSKLVQSNQFQCFY